MKNKDYSSSILREYKSYLAIAKGTPLQDLQNAIDYHRSNRSTLDTFLLCIGLRDEPLHIQAFEDALNEKIKNKTF